MAVFSFVKPLNLNAFTTSNISDCDQPCSNMQPTILSSINNTAFNETQTVENLSSPMLSDCSKNPTADRNKNCSNTIITSLDEQDIIRQSSINDNNNSVLHGECVKSASCPILKVQNVIPEELFINVESDDEGVHSWRPNISSNSLCSDFFMSPNLLHDEVGLTLPMFSQNENSECDNMSQSQNWTSELLPLPVLVNPEDLYNPLSRHGSSNLRIDIESHMHSQMVGLNIVKYEVINAKRKVNELKEAIKKTTTKLNEKLIVQRTLDVEKLKEENAQLRLECQCLCMEVDHYLKGKAPLGEVDESFYSEKLQSETKIEDQDLSQGNFEPADLENHNIDDQEDQKKWECRKCTFVNHPAINSCEMCHTQRLKYHSVYSSVSSDACYCHPKKESS